MEEGRAKKFYVPVLNALGFTVDQKIKDWVSYEAPQTEGRPTEFFGFTHDPNHKPNGNAHRVLGGDARGS